MVLHHIHGTVPAGVTKIFVEAWGGGGGGFTTGASYVQSKGGGGAGYAAAYIDVSEGQVVNMNVGVEVPMLLHRILHNMEAPHLFHTVL